MPASFSKRQQATIQLTIKQLCVVGICNAGSSLPSYTHGLTDSLPSRNVHGNPLIPILKFNFSQKFDVREMYGGNYPHKC